jgi:simple sugar transport system permease protein
MSNFFRKNGEPMTDTQLLLTITVSIFIGLYLLAFMIWGGGFRNPQQFIDIFNGNASLIIVSCGLSIVMVTGGIDISVGGITGLVTMACVVSLGQGGGNILTTLLLALAIGLAFGIAQGFLISYLEVQPFIITLAGMFFARGVTTMISVNPITAVNESFLALKDWRIRLPFLGSFSRQGNFIPVSIESGAIVCVIVVIVMFAVLKWTKFGRNLYAVGGNSMSAHMLGINVKRTKFFAYVLCGLLAGIAGFVYLTHTGAGDVANATQSEMKAIAASIIGGTLLTGGVGNIIGTLFGALTLQTIDQIVLASGLTEPWWQRITTGAMLCFFILLQSVVLAHRGKGGFRLPEWLMKKPDKSDANV